MKKIIIVIISVLFSVALFGQNTPVSCTLLRTDAVRTYKQSYIHHYSDEYFAASILSHPTNFSNWMGTSAGIVNTGDANMFFGYESGKINVAGMYNSAFGYKTLNANIIGNKLTALGYMAGYLNTVDDNTFVGYTSGYSNTTGIDNTYVGSGSGMNNSIGSNNTFVGKDAGLSNIAGENTFVGWTAGTLNTTGTGNTFIGVATGSKNIDGWGNTFIGDRAGLENIDGDGSVFVGFDAGQRNTTGIGNNFVGYKAGYSNTTADDNHAFGYNALYTNQTGTGNIAIGGAACLSATEDMNIGIGSMSLEYMTDGYRNIGIGDQSGNRLAGGDDNTFIGIMTGYWNIGGNYNVVVGNGAGEGVTPGAAYNNNTIIGYKSGYSLTTGSSNVFLGFNAGYNETGSNKLYIDNSSTATPLIYGDFSTDRIGIYNDLWLKDTLFYGGTFAAPADTIIPIDIDEYTFKRIGIGVASNSLTGTTYLQQHVATSTDNFFRLTNGATGSAVTDGLGLGVYSTGNYGLVSTEASKSLTISLGNAASNLVLSGTSGAYHTLTCTALDVTTSDANNPSLFLTNSLATGEGGPGGFTNTASAATNTNSFTKYVHAYRRTGGTTSSGFGGNNAYYLEVGTANKLVVKNFWSWVGLAAGAYSSRMGWALYNGATVDTSIVMHIEGIDIGQNKTWSYTYADSASYNNGLAEKSRTVTSDSTAYNIVTAKYGSGKVVTFNAGKKDQWANFIFDSDGTVYLESNSADVANTNTADKLCIYPSGTTIVIRNNIGSRTVQYTIRYQ